MDAFCRRFLEPVRARVGTYRHRGHLWHAFTFGLMDPPSRKQAWSLFASRACEPLMIVPEVWKRDFVGVRITANQEWPDLRETLLHQDCVVLPRSCDWGMCFDHEGCGPWFLEPPLPEDDDLDDLDGVEWDAAGQPVTQTGRPPLTE
ncbi:hypothetical protein Pla163_00500 [Planctomycetes bacterium Pla163]|uniref:Uncharacterized protein n=2 Tax=Rohdeia mirabilis TaxID=2528008 RepID=A0A518CUQ4_9BACT|nr:hypothetical protein Pla163_00500 [Planctomycetes bacterium Pla163]